MLKKLVKPVEVVKIQDQEIKLHGLTMEDLAEILESLPDEVLGMVGTGRDLNVMTLVSKFPQVANMLVVKSAHVEPDDVKESLEAVNDMVVAHKIMCLKRIWDLTVPDEAAATELKNVASSLYKKAISLGASTLPSQKAQQK